MIYYSRIMFLMKNWLFTQENTNILMKTNYPTWFFTEIHEKHWKIDVLPSFPHEIDWKHWKIDENRRFALKNTHFHMKNSFPIIFKFSGGGERERERERLAVPCFFNLLNALSTVRAVRAMEK